MASLIQAVAKSTRRRPGLLLVLGFALVIGVGTALLLVPIAKAGPGSASVLDALFTAVSATCVTGLVVVDTATYWTPFGQVVIMLLIQIGGFGVMTFASVLGLVVSRRLTLRSQLATAVEVKTPSLSDVRTLIVGVVTISLVVEGVIATILTARFATTYNDSFGEALWNGAFHAVSSFNNAGFALFSDSMVGFVADPVISLAICTAIIIGGLGFPVIMQLRRHIRVPRLWNVNTRIVLVGTATLLVTGTVFVTVIEWNNPGTLGTLSAPEKILAGFFQAVQTRTAGFNSVDIGALEPATLLGMDVLMFIGGGPAGTAGGIKITTFAVLFFIILTEIRGQGAVNVFGKRLSRSVHRQAITVVLLSVAVVTIATMILLLTTPHALDEVLFEAVSAFGTVGLSAGITASLPPIGQIVLIVLMFLGRVGPITVASALALRQKRIMYELPKERPIIG